MADQHTLDRAYMRMATQWGNDMSRAVRLKVGAIVVKDGQIISDGFNGMPSGMDNVCETTYHITKEEYDKNWSEIFNCNFDTFLETTKAYRRLKTKPEVLHAESNALMKLARSTNSSVGATLYCNYSPCFECSKLIIQSGIVRVVYVNEYRITTGLNLLKKCGVKVNKLNSDDIYQ